MTSIKQILASIACDHLEMPTLHARNSDSLDFYTVSVWSIAAALNAAFEAGATCVQREAIDVYALLSERHQVAVIWSIEDVLEVRPDLSDDQAWKVLQECERVHDCNYGFTWDLIRYGADDLYPVPGKGDGQ
jgi:hypothetical protein